MRDLSASIVIYKSNCDMLKQAIESFLQSTEDSLLYLIDNSPTDKARSLAQHPRVTYIFNNQNIGFGAAHNIALRLAIKSSARYHVVLNPDVYFDARVTTELRQFMDNNQEIGLAMPKVLYPNGQLQPLCKLLPNPYTLILRRFFNFHKRLLEKQNHAYELHFSGYDKIMDVPFLSGCFMFLRVEAIRTVGLFDERIFLYTEDMDLSRRIHQRFRTVFYPHVSIHHYHQRGSYHNPQLLLYNIQSAIRYFNKWGWFFDKEREQINQRVLLKLQNEF
jgi:GT2 family glycosyltransferase